MTTIKSSLSPFCLLIALTFLSFTAISSTNAQGNLPPVRDAGSDITVELPAPPEVFCVTDKALLWPPNHKMQEVNITVIAFSTAVESPSELVLLCNITSDEPDSRFASDELGKDASGDVDGKDGYTAPVEVTLEYNEEVGGFVGVVDLRAERLGNGDGRTYTLTCTAVDPFGQTGEDSCEVLVPHDMGDPAARQAAKDAKEAAKAAKKAAKAADKAAKRAAKEADKAAKRAAKEREKAAKEARKAAEKAAKEAEKSGTEN